MKKPLSNTTMLLLLGLLSSSMLVSSFVVVPAVPKVHKTNVLLSMDMTNSDDDEKQQQKGGRTASLDRRFMLSLVPAILVGGASAGLLQAVPQMALADNGKKIVVMGGAGYVGSRVSTGLAEAGYQVVSVSRSSPTDQAAKVKANVGKAPSNIQYVSLDATTDDLSGVMKDASVVVSCLGIPPWEKSTARAGNGVANVRIAQAAKAAGTVDKYVYVSVAKEFSSGPGKFLFSEYFEGKKEAEAAATQNFADKLVLVKPGFIDGAPPGEIRPPGPPGLAAVSPDAVAKATIAGALGKVSGSIDGYNAIMAVVQ